MSVTFVTPRCLKIVNCCTFMYVVLWYFQLEPWQSCEYSNMPKVTRPMTDLFTYPFMILYISCASMLDIYLFASLNVFTWFSWVQLPDPVRLRLDCSRTDEFRHGLALPDVICKYHRFCYQVLTRLCPPTHSATDCWDCTSTYALYVCSAATMK